MKSSHDASPLFVLASVDLKAFRDVFIHLDELTWTVGLFSLTWRDLSALDVPYAFVEDLN